MVKRYYSFAGIYLFTFAALGTLLPMIGQYLDYIGFSGVQIGIITAAGTAVGIGASPFWGYRSHRCRDISFILLCLCALAALLDIGLSFIKTFMAFLLLFTAFSFFQTPIMPLSDALTLENKLPYGAVRKWGSIAFAAGVFISGQLAAATDLVIIFPLSALGYIIGWVLIMRLRKQGLVRCPEPRPEAGRKARRGSYINLLRNKKLMALLFAAFFICGTNVANNTYFGFLYRDVGGSIAGVGIALLLMCSSEAPFMAWMEKLEKLCPMQKMILVAMIVSALRYLWYSTGPAPGLLIGAFFLQGLVNGITIVQIVRYVARLVEPAMIGMAMTLYQALSSNCSVIVCQLVGGVILDHFGPTHVYLFFSIYNAIGVVLFVGFGLYKCRE